MTQGRWKTILWIFCAIAMGVFVTAIQPAFAITRTVTNTSNSGAGSLRDTVAAATSGDVVNFSVTGTITLATPISVTVQIAIAGPGANLLTISGNNITRIFDISSTVTISGLTLQNGLANNTALRGGAINNTGSLTLDGVALKSNVAFDGGGAIYNVSTSGASGQLRISNSQLSGNSVSDTSGIGGGAILSTSTTGSAAMVTIINSTITANTANANANGMVGGGIYFANGALKLLNSTVVANSAGIAGGNIHRASVANTSLTLRNSIVSAGALSGAGAAAADIDIFQPGGAAVISLGYNIVTNRSAGSGYAGTDAAPGTLPVLGALAANGGPTQTMLPLAMSPATAFVPLASCVDDASAALTRDQRGVQRRAPTATTCDAGATEATRLSIDTALPNAAIGNAYSQTLVATGGAAPYSFSLDTGTLPNGLTLTGAGVVSGTLTTAGTFPFTVRVTDVIATTATRAYSIVVVAVPCSPGSYSATGNTPCTLASPGSFVALPGATTQTACAVGTYSSAPGATACTLASPGSFVATTGATSQTACAIGSYSAVAGASACTLASAGSFVSTSGAVSQTACPVGSFSPTTGATSCTLAAIGFFVPNVGSTSQTACPAGTTTLAVGASACVPITFTVTSSAGANGSITPSGAQTVNFGATPSFTLAPNAGFGASVNGTCGGSLDGLVYTTVAITADCTVVAAFTILANSTTTLTSSLNPSKAGQTVTLTATVSGGSGTPTGNVVFRDGGNVIASCASVALSGGTAACVTSGIPLGMRSITAQYLGNATYNSSTSAALIQTVNPNTFPLAPILYFLLD